MNMIWKIDQKPVICICKQVGLQVVCEWKNACLKYLQSLQCFIELNKM